MNDTTDAPNEEQTTEANGGVNIAETPEEDPREPSGGDRLDWQSARERIEELRNQRKTRRYTLGDGSFMEFEIRMLDQDEHDAAEDAAVNIEERRNKREVVTDSGAIKDIIIKYGVVSGPEGFDPERKADREALPYQVRDDLAESIEEFSQLDEESERAF